MVGSLATTKDKAKVRVKAGGQEAWLKDSDLTLGQKEAKGRFCHRMKGTGALRLLFKRIILGIVCLGHSY